MPHSVCMYQPKESVVVSKELMMDILEEVFQIIGLSFGNALKYIHKLMASMTN